MAQYVNISSNILHESEASSSWRDIASCMGHVEAVGGVLSLVDSGGQSVNCEG